MKGRRLIRGLALVIALLLGLTGTAGAEGGDTSQGTGGEWRLDGNGFLVSGPAAEYVLVDEENGIWQYASADLAVRINRFREEVAGKNKKTRIREYCVAEIYASQNAPLGAVLSQPTKKRPAGYKLVSPELLMEAHPSVFSMSDDLFGIRLQKYKYYGVVIRNGEILARKTRDSSQKRPWPNLDTLAVYADGSMKAFACDAMTPEEYLESGATQVFSFGPVLISDGEINETVLDPKYYPYNEPRAAIGMVEPWHYIAIVVRGRPEKTYIGAHLDWVAEKMKAYGCVEALNLDGGLTATMAFMGRIIQTGGPSLRSQGSMIVFGERNEP